MNATIVVSCYNQQKYIAECLDSILSQEVSFDYNILVSDDCSTDQTPEILKEYGKRFPTKINLSLHTKNLGAAKNYLYGHQNATGDIIFHFDGDDIMYPGKLQQQFDVFNQNPDVNLVFHRASYFTDAMIKRHTGPLPSDGMEKVRFTLKDLALWGTVAVHSSYAYRKSSRITKSLDREFMEWFFAMDSLLNGGAGVYINNILVGYRSNPNGGSYLSTPRGRKKSYLLYFNDLFIYFENLKQYRNQLYANAFVTFLGMSLNGKHFDKKITCFLIKNIKHLRPYLILETFKTRKSVQPKDDQ